MCVNATQTPVNRSFKARIFEMIFSNKEELLSLYNAVNGTDYKNSDELEINTLENAIYMAMHNDISFVIGFYVSLYEHQSTYSPNLPLRYLLYISDVYSAMTKNMNLYGETAVALPAPRFIIFYNGAKKRPEREELQLSALYKVKEENPSLELRATLLNINPGFNDELKRMCKTLGDYAEYTARIRQYAQEMPIELAVEHAITECIKEGILAEFLSRQRAEAKSVSIYEYDEEKHLRMEREENYEKGYKLGEEAGYKLGAQQKVMNQVKKKLARGASVDEIASALEEEPETIKEIMDALK